MKQDALSPKTVYSASTPGWMLDAVTEVQNGALTKSVLPTLKTLANK